MNFLIRLICIMCCFMIWYVSIWYCVSDWPQSQFYRSDVHENDVNEYIKLGETYFEGDNVIPKVNHPSKCIGLNTIPRALDDRRYFMATMSSIFLESSKEEIEDVYLYIGKGGSSENLDKDISLVSKYAHVEHVKLSDISKSKKWEQNLVDMYIRLLQVCINQNSSYIFILEDDILVSKNFITKSVSAMDDLLIHGNPISYLKLYRTTTYTGFSLNSNIPITVIFLFMTPMIISVLLVFILIRILQFKSKHFLSSHYMSTIYLFLAIVMLLYLTGLPNINSFVLPHGVYQLDLVNKKDGATVGHVYSNSVARKIVKYLSANSKNGPADHLLGYYARDNEPAYELIPHLVQHVGTISSSTAKANIRDENWIPGMTAYFINPLTTNLTNLTKLLSIISLPSSIIFYLYKTGSITLSSLKKH